MPPVVDVHAHVFPPAVRDRRDALLATEPAFREMYASDDAKMATADDVLASMDQAGVDRTVVLNFAWRDESLIEKYQPADRTSSRPACRL